MITLTGKKVAEGIAVGRLTFYKRGKKEIRRIYVEDAKKEVLRFKKACERFLRLCTVSSTIWCKFGVFVYFQSFFTNEVHPVL